MYQQFYSRFLAANQGKQHFACHSHYFWPDVTRDAQLQYWDDSAQYVDHKWEYFFTDCVPELQQKIARILQAPAAEQIVFAPNTHELLYRIITCFDPHKPLRILTTDSEFHSFNRQSTRMEELPNVNVTRIPTQPFATFEQRFKHALQTQAADLVFFSQVFFNSGMALSNVDALVEAVPDSDTVVVVDGYHGFMAIPTDLSRVCQRAFYLGGSYKYAQGGEGACFAIVPTDNAMRPLYTGWFAEFGELSQAKAGQVGYSKNGMRFAGATMDFSALYRLRAVLRLFDENNLDVAVINQFIKHCQQTFLTCLDEVGHPLLCRERLIMESLEQHGHFLAFDLPSAHDAQSLHDHLHQHGILTDYRGNRLRFGFGLYHNPLEYDFSCLKQAPSC
ncbi:aminotransferase class V-fold PLP-dependent enzyme [Alteromonas oceanisediminis]|uniref:aminotransferase class V-fold PLP-dependent enzyme n=1 Tax=Alteromonas oceanisediminis TaxID=2836180 RepID=UPI001BD929E3|nr:aminotransferase class V-fold PLP-dependent enzyme [Alteromonas oceanisediminis]MBT0585995.1 aminotransferase class V-fold PLP-dependent enzyme [Alteromonas oceanisediminis]